MLKKILILITSLIFTACSNSSSTETTVDSKNIPSALINKINISTWMYQIQDLFIGNNIDILDNTNYDMLVVEPSINFKGETHNTNRLVSALSTKPNGDKRLLVAYIDIGQAEEYRDYWKDDWIAPTKESVGSPDFMITIDPDGWSGNYPVAYWDKRWKDIWLEDDGIIVKLATEGFDGIYLDWIEAYDEEKIMKYAQTQNIDAKREMINFIKELKAKGREINPNFVVIAQNAQYLLDYDPTEYASVIDAIATEDTWFYGEGDAPWNSTKAGDLHGGERHQDEFSTENRIKQSSKYLDLGIPVFTVDYCISKENADDVYNESRENGFIPIVTRVSLSQLSQTPPPKFSSKSRSDSAYKLEINLEGSLQNPAFSPDGKSILFTRFQNGYNQEPADIYTFNLKSKEVTKLVSNGSANINLPGSVWNRNIDKIVYSSSKDEHDEIYMIDPNGKNELQITSREKFMAYEPSFSPDGTVVVFESHPLDVEGEGVITKYSVDGSSNYIALTPTEEDARQPNWSPDGSKILYQKLVDNQWDIWTMNIDGSNKIKVTKGIGDKTDASFSSKGESILYSSDIGLEYANIFEVNLSSGETKQLTDYKEGYDGAVSISTDNKKLIFESSVGDPDDSEGTEIWMVEDSTSFKLPSRYKE